MSRRIIHRVRRPVTGIGGTGQTGGGNISAISAPTHTGAGNNAAKRVLLWSSAYQLRYGQSSYWSTRGFGGFQLTTGDLYSNGWDVAQLNSTSPTYDLQHGLYGNPSSPNTFSTICHNASGKCYLGVRLSNGNALNGKSPIIDWFDDSGWTTWLAAFGKFVAVAYALGFDGISFDQELYSLNGGGFATWNWNYSGNSHGESATRAQVKTRGQQLMATVVANFPNCEMLAYGGYLPEGWNAYIQTQKQVKSATSATPTVITTGTSSAAVAHGYTTGEQVLISGVYWTITVVDSTRFSLDGSTSANAPSAGTYILNENDTHYDNEVIINLWDGMTSTTGWSKVFWLDATFYKTPQFGTWTGALTRATNTHYDYLSRAFSSWSYARSRWFHSPFIWIDWGANELPFAALRSQSYVEDQLNNFRQWGGGGTLACFGYQYAIPGAGYGADSSKNMDYDATGFTADSQGHWVAYLHTGGARTYADALRSAATDGVVDSDYPGLGTFTFSSSTRVMSGTATDAHAVKSVRWSDAAHGTSGEAALTWVKTGDFTSGYTWSTSWTFTLPVGYGSSIVVVAEDQHGLTTSVTVTLS